MTLYYRRFRYVAVTECDDVVAYNPITCRVIFKYLVLCRYLIAALTNAFIILMFGHCSFLFKIRALIERVVDILSVEIENSAALIIRIHNPLSSIEQVNLRTLDNVFVYTNIIEKSLLAKAKTTFLDIFQLSFILDKLDTGVLINCTTIK